MPIHQLTLPPPVFLVEIMPEPCANALPAPVISYSPLSIQRRFSSLHHHDLSSRGVFNHLSSPKPFLSPLKRLLNGCLCLCTLFTALGSVYKGWHSFSMKACNFSNSRLQSFIMSAQSTVRLSSNHKGRHKLELCNVLLVLLFGIWQYFQGLKANKHFISLFNNFLWNLIMSNVKLKVCVCV